MKKKLIVISAVSLFQGGPLSILIDCLSELDNNFSGQYSILAFTHKNHSARFPNIHFHPIPWARKSYFHRLYAEYFLFRKLSKRIYPYLWFSLHDMTPNVKAEIRAVYCHNPSPFYKISFREFILEPSFGLFNLFYKYLYKINLNKNNFIVVQQNWLRDIFRNSFHARSEIVVAPPNISIGSIGELPGNEDNTKILFFYPSLPRVFKNFECICDAAKQLSSKGFNFELVLTLSGNENRYARQLVEKYGTESRIRFIGLISREQVYTYYKQCDCLVFPSKLETWGLPITEAKAFHKPILAADLPYAHETVGNYEQVSFFNPDNSCELVRLMEQIIDKKIVYDGNIFNNNIPPFANNWAETFNILLK